MNRTLVALALLAATGLPVGRAARVTGTGVAFAVCDYTQGKVFLVGADASPTWSYDAPDTNDLHLRDAPLLLEITPDKKMVWTYEDHDVLRTASSVLILDPSGRPPKGLLVH